MKSEAPKLLLDLPNSTAQTKYLVLQGLDEAVPAVAALAAPYVIVRRQFVGFQVDRLLTRDLTRTFFEPLEQRSPSQWQFPPMTGCNLPYPPDQRITAPFQPWDVMGKFLGYEASTEPDILRLRTEYNAATTTLTAMGPTTRNRRTRSHKNRDA